MKYQDDDIASDSDDQKKIRAAESRALRKQKSSSYQGNRGYGEYNVAYDSVSRASSCHNFRRSFTQACAAAPSAGRSKPYQIFFLDFPGQK